MCVLIMVMNFSFIKSVRKDMITFAFSGRNV
jgi:hypothetical protein